MARPCPASVSDHTSKCTGMVWASVPSQSKISPAVPAGADQGSAVVTLVDRALGSGEELMEQGGELVERHRRVVGFERRPVEVGAELGGEVVVRVALEAVAHVAVEAEEVEEVVALEDGVLLDHPVVGVVDERLDDGGTDVGVVERPEGVADVVEQGARYVLVVTSGPVGARGGLQGVREAVDLETAEVAVEQAQVGD